MRYQVIDRKNRIPGKGNKRVMIVYKSTNQKNGKVYICVSGKNLNDTVSRRLSHARAKPRKMKLKDAYMGKSPFDKAIRKYGSYSFKFQILQNNVSEKEAYQYKEAYIKAYNAMDPDYGYNCTTGGNKSFKNAPHVKERCRVAQTGKTMPDSYVELMKARVGELHPRFGIKHSKQARENMRQGQLNSNYVQSEDTKKRKSETMKRRWQEPEVIAKMAKRELRDISGKNNPMYGVSRKGKNNPMYGKQAWNRGVPMTEEQKKKLQDGREKYHTNKRKESLEKYSQRTEKKCCACKEIKALDMFYKSSPSAKSLDGFVSRCKPCSRKYGKEKYYRLHSPNKFRNRYGELIDYGS